MNILARKWSFDRLQFAGLGLVGALLVGCGTPKEDNSSSSNSSSSSSTSSTVSSSVSSSSSSVAVIPQDYDHCTDGGYRPHPTNGFIGDGGHAHERNGEVDLSVDPVVYDYMYENGWQDAHVLWHQARTCGGFFGGNSINGLPSACNFPELLPEQNDCEGDQNGLEFLAAHSLMMYQLRELWPDHIEQFSGWETFPRTAQDYPEEIRGRFKGWSQQILQAADIGDNIEQNMDMFPTEGALGSWISCAIMPGAGGFADFSTQRNLHFALHDNAAGVRNQKHAVNNNNNNLDAYLFYKLHSWIDHVWMRYRAAKGKTKESNDFKEIMQDQCHEMDAWREIAVEARGADGHPNQDEDIYLEIPEAGYFHDSVRPILEQNCVTCHGQGEEAGLRLGYQISSTEVVERLINADSHYTQGFKLVVPGKPEESWLYLKASGESTSMDVQCQGIADGCNSKMGNLNSSQIEVIRKWIADGAHLPIILN